MLGEVRFLGKYRAERPAQNGASFPWDEASHERYLERQAFRDMKTWVDNCGYCGVSSAQRPGTFDHIRPDSAGGDETLSNGVAVCSPCNGERSNVPFLNFLEGERGRYEYKNGGKNVLLLDVAPAPFARRCEEVQRHFARYLQGLLRNTSKLPAGWFSKTLDNLIYPVWGYGQEPTNPVLKYQMAQKQLERLVRVVAPQDRTFWLGQEFHEIARKTLDPDKFKMVRQAVGEAQRSLGTALRFGASRLNAMFNKPAA